MPFDALEPYDPECGEPPDDRQLFHAGGHAELDPGPIAGRLVREDHAFTHLREGEATILFLMRVVPKEKGGRLILGEMCLPRFTGTLGNVALWMLACLCDGIPDYIMVLDATWWTQATPLQREALVFHELEHATQKIGRDGEPVFTPDGKPVWDIRAHSIEEFDSVARRYGAWKGDIQSFIEALRRGGAI